MVFHWSLSDSKSPQVSRIRLRILAFHRSAVIWIVSTCTPTSKSSRPYFAKSTNHNWYNRYFHVPQLFQFSSKFEVLILLFTFLQIYSMVRRVSKVHNFASSLFFFFFFVGLLDGIRWSVCMLKSHRSLCVSFSRTGAGLCVFHLLVWSNLNFFHISRWITLLTQSCLALYSFCANLLHSLIMWLSVSSLLSHSLHLLFCCVLSILVLIWLILMALSCAATRRDSVSL